MNSVIDRVLAQARSQPDRVAVSGVTYGALARKVCGLSRQITSPRVLIACAQGPNAYIAMLAALHAGATYAPINIDAPQDRQQLIRDRFDPGTVICDTAQSAEGWGDSSLIVGAEADPCPPVASDAPAYVMFTSGSTGTPKGVVISRRAMNHYIDWVVSALALTPHSRVSQHPNIGFDFSVMDIFGSLAAGAELVPIVSMKDRLFPAQAIRRFQLTHWISVPSVVDLMLRGKGLQKGDLDSLGKMVFCGEALLPHHLERIFEVAPDLQVLNTYGPTEATVSVTEQPLTRDTWRQFSDGSLALGTAIPGMEITLDGGSDCEGEIIISGPQVADGYWQDAERTRAAFDGQRYRTGDWGEIVNGALYFRARIDRQVKLHGFRIELGEIDSAVRAVLGVAAASFLHEDELVCFVETPDVDVVATQKALARTLPDYMIPPRLIPLEMLPRSVNDKIDHLALANLLEKNELGDDPRRAD